MLLALLNAQQVTALGIVEGAMDLTFQQLRVAEYRLQRRAEFVAEESQLGGPRSELKLENPIALVQLPILEAQILIGEAIARFACFARYSAQVSNAVFLPGRHRLQCGEGSRTHPKHPLCNSRA